MAVTVACSECGHLRLRANLIVLPDGSLLCPEDRAARDQRAIDHHDFTVPRAFVLPELAAEDFTAGLTAGLALEVAGLAAVEASSAGFLLVVRAALRKLAADEHRPVSVDDARRIAASRHLAPLHRNVWGVIFRTAGWHRVGEAPSTLPGNHAHRNALWEPVLQRG